MTEEIQTQEQPQNTVATVGMRFSIIWLIALITIIFIWFSFPLLFIWFILWIIGLFYKPRGKARVAISIPLVVFIVIASVICYIWSSVKTPVKEFMNWMEVQSEQINQEDFDNDRFNDITNEEINIIRSSMSEEEIQLLIQHSTWSNTLEKWAYVVFGLIQQVIENSLEKYNNELPEIEEETDTNNETISEDETLQDNEVEETNNEIVENNNENTENVEVFTQSEKNDIEQILNILE